MNINPFDILKNAQKLQENLGSFQEKLSAIYETGSAGGGMVKIELNGKLEVMSVHIDPAVVDPSDVQVLQDLVADALADGMEKIKERIQREAGSMAGGIMPGIFG
ncbi:MAG: YbaB/EbfC family nucleoid-associated protein [Treponema sp.]|nr:YbaB/EbfC family nucleoid-associated protein [Treponema sp.]